MKATKRIAKATLAIAAVGFFAGTAMAQTASAPMSNTAEATYKDIEATLGIVPSFLKAFPQSGVAAKANGATDEEIKEAVAMSAKTATGAPSSTACRSTWRVSSARWIL